ncbi:MAG TPA: SAM-dependent chlorinase/fluorinase [Thermoplasmata archaeon]|nr:SAM-dependent chlorinase/fluorinase [Thermoplasmata archaeon]
MRRSPPVERPPAAPLVTLSTDIGWEYAAQVKAVLYARLPAGSVVDLTHEIRPHAVREAAFLVRHMANGYPPGSVHLAIVDPGVGGSRAPLAIQCRDGSFLVGPDNGVLMPLARELGLQRAVRLEPKRVVGGRSPSATFEGRDLFAPAAALLATGSPLEALGPKIRPLELRLPSARRRGNRAVGELVHIDRFGNLISNVPTAWIPPRTRTAQLTLSRRAPRTLPLVRTYSELPFEELGVLGSSFGLVEVAQREGSAADRIGAAVGERLELRWSSEAAARTGSA